MKALKRRGFVHHGSTLGDGGAGVAIRDSSAAITLKKALGRCMWPSALH